SRTRVAAARGAERAAPHAEAGRGGDRQGAELRLDQPAADRAQMVRLPPSRPRNYFTPASLAAMAEACGYRARFGATDKLPTSDNMYAVLHKACRPIAMKFLVL